jgi:hypothetical protein
MPDQGTPTQAETAQLLRALYEYVVRHTPSHPLLLPAIPALGDAGRVYGSGDSHEAFRRGMAVYQFLRQSMRAYPDLPLP